MKILRLVLGDQLNHFHSWYENKSSDTTYLLIEMRQETDYVAHHIQKVASYFAAMRSFADYLRDKGHSVLYLRLDDEKNQQDLAQNLHQILKEISADRFEYQLPDEYRLDEQISDFVRSLDIEWQAFDTEHFLSGRHDLQKFFEGKKTYLLESFYRDMRRKFDIMMEGKDPEGGKWNFDKENRKSLPADPDIPQRSMRSNDVSDIVDMIRKAGVETIGRIDPKHHIWPTSRREALADLNQFCSDYLHNFGTYQDAMHSDHVFNYHSLLSFAMNSKMLHPLEVVQKVIATWRENSDKISIAQVEGFVRQIIGWREFMRGVYWAKMPKYASMNALDHQRKLPGWYWTGETKMNCVSHAIRQSLDYAYAHHIQRLMITGNFALLAGVHPDNIDEWYLGIYIDAIEWVEITNTRGMSQYADDGIVGTKPYVSSSNYIKKMSNYCNSCHYSQTKKTGERACPFNSLYWHFYDRHREKFGNNPRIAMMYRTLDRMDEENRREVLKQADEYLENIENL